jgi:hypothetical protein
MAPHATVEVQARTNPWHRPALSGLPAHFELPEGILGGLCPFDPDLPIGSQPLVRAPRRPDNPALERKLGV